MIEKREQDSNIFIDFLRINFEILPLRKKDSKERL